MNTRTVAISIVALGFVLTLTWPRAADAQASKPAQNVLVTNTAAEPVPTTLQGQPSVNIANTPTVTIGNGPAASVPVKIVGGQPFRIVRYPRTVDGEIDAVELLYTPPAGQVLIIDYVSVSCQVLSGNVSVLIFVGDIGFPAGGRYRIPLTETNTPNSDRFVGSEQVRILATGNEPIQLVVARTESTGGMLCPFAMTGRIVQQ